MRADPATGEPFCRTHPRARAKQRPPEWDWLTWLILSGRGFGKTRTGAQWVIDCARRLPTNGRFALVGQTAADVRDVMVEGDSGIMRCSPPWFKPLYEPSKRRLTWPNGFQAFCYSSEEPGYFRGPQFHGAWCLSGDTLVLMGDGTEKEISRVRRGDAVVTRTGVRRVIASVMTKRDAAVFRVEILGGRTIIGTYEHPVWVSGRGFVPISQLKPGMMACVSNASSGAERSGTATVTDTMKLRSGYTAKSGLRRTGRSRPAMTFITRTKTRPTTGLKTWNCLPDRNTLSGILRRRSDLTGTRPSTTRTSPGREKLRSGRSGTSFVPRVETFSIAGPPTRRGSVLRRVLSRLVLARSVGTPVFVNIVGRNSRRPNGCKSIVQRTVTTRRSPSDSLAARRGQLLAIPAAKNSGVRGSTRDFVAGSVGSVTTAPIISVEKLAERIDVYDLAIEGDREFFANGVLVHNCDELAKWTYLDDCWDNLQFGLRLGAAEGWVPRVCITTTPLPIDVIKSLKKDKSTALVEGSTFENEANLAKSAIDRLRAKYEGTRLGEQELYGKILEDTPGALWRPGVIDPYRVKLDRVPEIIRLGVAVDPSVGDPAKAARKRDDHIAEAGIVVGGLGEDDHFYILEDVSVKGHPILWGNTAVSAYYRHAADFLVAEINNGGKLIETLIQSIDDSVNYREVTASRGKRTRAEPIAALYEQGKVHHVGHFLKLEEELTTWVPDSGMKSPNRLDALVWVLTELSFGGVPVRLGGNPFPGWRG